VLSYLRPIALRKHSSLEESNKITASIPLFINSIGGTILSEGFTSKDDSLISNSLTIGSHSFSGIYPLRAVSRSLAYAKFDGKSINIHPFFSIFSILSNSFFNE
jgi:hypothetical protein